MSKSQRYGPIILCGAFMSIPVFLILAVNWIAVALRSQSGSAAKKVTDLPSHQTKASPKIYTGEPDHSMSTPSITAHGLMVTAVVLVSALALALIVRWCWTASDARRARRRRRIELLTSWAASHRELDAQCQRWLVFDTDLEALRAKPWMRDYTNPAVITAIESMAAATAISREVFDASTSNEHITERYHALNAATVDLGAAITAALVAPTPVLAKVG